MLAVGSKGAGHVRLSFGRAPLFVWRLIFTAQIAHGGVDDNDHYFVSAPLSEILLMLLKPNISNFLLLTPPTITDLRRT